MYIKNGKLNFEFLLIPFFLFFLLDQNAALACSTLYDQFLTEDYLPPRYPDLDHEIVAVLANKEIPLDYFFVSSICKTTPKYSTVFLRSIANKLPISNKLDVLFMFSSFIAKKVLSEGAISYTDTKLLLKTAISHAINANVSCSELEKSLYLYYTYTPQRYATDICKGENTALNEIERLKKLIKSNLRTNTLVKVEKQSKNDSNSKKKTAEEDHVECISSVEAGLLSLPDCFPGGRELKKELSEELCMLNDRDFEIALTAVMNSFKNCYSFKLSNGTKYIYRDLGEALILKDGEGFSIIDRGRFLEYLLKDVKDSVNAEKIEEIEEEYKNYRKDWIRTYKKQNFEENSTQKMSTSVILLFTVLLLILFGRGKENAE